MIFGLLRTMLYSSFRSYFRISLKENLISPYVHISCQDLVLILHMNLSYPRRLSYISLSQPLYHPKSIVRSRNQDMSRVEYCRLAIRSYTQSPARQFTPQQTNVAPPVSIASISASVYGVRLNLAGRSLRSKYSPAAGVTGPRSRPATEPMAPSLRMLRPRGPCCCAC